ncbi:MAG: TIGR04283 family arsenosugar biosynthesis glycosyltransferase [Hyphomicrobiales bacterium]|nr:TIGR04283 family arsenosugar biosynthesis glycosyltransferase [Hyphomicrobiales bacterium]
MISVVIPTLDAEAGLTSTLSALVPATVQGVVREVIIADGGSRDATASIADIAGAHFIRAARGRGTQMAAGAAAARSDWLLFLHADTVLETGWEREAAAFMERVDAGERPPAAAAFRFALDDFGLKPRLLEAMVGARCTVFRFPYGDQGLLIPRRLYEALGGFRPIPLMEDVDMVRRLGRRRLVMMRARAVTSAVRYKRDGYLARVLRNFACVSLYYLRIPPRTIVRLYG